MIISEVQSTEKIIALSPEVHTYTIFFTAED
jgi:hypothetical protein